jgi:hypothetical protein
MTDPANDVNVMAPANATAEYKPILLGSIFISSDICGAKTGTVIIAIAMAI